MFLRIDNKQLIDVEHALQHVRTYNLALQLDLESLDIHTVWVVVYKFS